MDTWSNNVSIKGNELVSREVQEFSNIERAPLIEISHQEIVLMVKINGKITPAILDTSSPVTVISQRLYDDIANILEERGVRVDNDMLRPKIKLFP